MSKNKNVRFIRKRGRIIPIRVKKEISAAKELSSKKNIASLGKIAAVTAASFASLYGAGRLFRHSRALSKLGMKKSSNISLRAAKIAKFSSHASHGVVAGAMLNRLERRTKKDEKSLIFNVGGVTTSAVGGYASYRLGKRFEHAGKLGLSLLKKATFRKIKFLKDI